jgi:hypothetical protein
MQGEPVRPESYPHRCVAATLSECDGRAFDVESLQQLAHTRFRCSPHEHCRPLIVTEIPQRSVTRTNLRFNLWGLDWIQRRHNTHELIHWRGVAECVCVCVMAILCVMQDGFSPDER